MKKNGILIAVGLVLIGLLWFFILRESTEKEGQSHISGTIVEMSGPVGIGEESITFESEDRRNSGLFSVYVEQSNEYQIGDRITVYFEGAILERSPAVFQKVIRIEEETK